MNAYKLPNGNLLVPMRAEGDGILGDGWVEVTPTSEEGKKWVTWYKKQGKEIPPAPRASGKAPKGK